MGILKEIFSKSFTKDGLFVDCLIEKKQKDDDRIEKARDRYNRQSGLFDESKHPRDESGQFRSIDHPDMKTEFGYAGMREGFQVNHSSGAVARGYIADADFTGDKMSPTRGELFYTEVPPAHRRKGIGSQLAEHVLKTMQKNGTKTVNLNGVSKEGRALIQSLLGKGLISGPLRTSSSGTSEYTIGPDGKSETNPIHEVHGDDGMIARVFPHAKGFSVALHDSDAGETVPVMRIFDNLEAAKKHADTLAPKEIYQRIEAAKHRYSHHGFDPNEPRDDHGRWTDETGKKESKHDDEGRLIHPKTGQVQAKKGGETSAVDGVFYNGGQWMPVHGLTPKTEKKPKGEFPFSTASEADEDGKRKDREPREKRVWSPEQIEEERLRREARDKWDRVKDGPLGELFHLGDQPGRVFRSGGNKQWEQFANKLGSEKFNQFVEKLESLATESVREQAEEKPERKGENKSDGYFTTGETVELTKEYWKELAVMSQQYMTKKFIKSHPQASLAMNMADDWLQKTSFDGICGLSDFVRGLVS